MIGYMAVTPFDFRSFEGKTASSTVQTTKGDNRDLDTGNLRLLPPQAHSDLQAHFGTVGFNFRSLIFVIYLATYIAVSIPWSGIGRYVYMSLALVVDLFSVITAFRDFMFKDPNDVASTSPAVDVMIHVSISHIWCFSLSVLGYSYLTLFLLVELMDAKTKQSVYHSDTFSAAGSVMMSFKPINAIHQHLCAFHFYS